MSPLLILCAAMTACGSDDGGSGNGGGLPPGLGGPPGSAAQGDVVDCEWFNGPDNCWNAVMDQAAACTPESVVSDDPDLKENVAQLNADRTECAYADGTTVRFPAGPVPELIFPKFGEYDWAAEVYDPDGALCVAYDSEPEERGFAVRLADDAVYRQDLFGVLEDDGGWTQITCGDGSFKKIKTRDMAGNCGIDAFAGFSSAGPFFFMVFQRGLDSETKHTIYACEE